MPTAHLNNIDLHYETHGDGPPLLLAHGYTATLEMWRPQVQALSQKHTLVIYDSRGHGKTSAPPADMEAYDLARDFVADQVALMDHLGIEQAYVGGLSMGGMITQEFALQHPDRVRALILCDTGAGVSGTARNPAVAARMERWRGIARTLAKTKGMAALVDAMRNSPVASSMFASSRMPEAARAYFDNLTKMTPDGFLGSGKALQEWPGVLEKLSSLTMPALVVVGENDSLLPASRIIHQQVAGSRFVLLRDAGHGSSLWRPHAFAQAILDFLADVESGAPIAGTREM